MDAVHRQVLVLASLFVIIGQYCLTKAQYPYPSPSPYPYPYPYPLHRHPPTNPPTHLPIHPHPHALNTTNTTTHTNKTAQVHDSYNSTKLANNTDLHRNQSAHAAPPEALECQHFLVSVALKKRPPAPEEGGPFQEMQCHICDNIKMIYRCYPCFTSVEVHNVTNSANNHSFVNLLMNFTCKGKHLKVLEAILKPHSILHSKCFQPACHAPALVHNETICAPVTQQCTTPVCAGSSPYHVTPYPTPCPTSYPVAVVNVPQEVHTPLSVPVPYHSSLAQASHSEENKENETEVEKEKETEPQPIQLVGQTYIFPETYGQPTHHQRTDNKAHETYTQNYGFPGQYSLSVNPNPCTPQCLNVCAPACPPACCRSLMSQRYKAFIQRMRNAANARALKYRNYLRPW